MSFDSDEARRAEPEARIAAARARPVTPVSPSADLAFIRQFAPDFEIARTGETEYTGGCVAVDVGTHAKSFRATDGLRFRWVAATPEIVVFLAAAYFRERGGARTAGLTEPVNTLPQKIVNAALNGKTELANQLTNEYLGYNSQIKHSRAT